MKTLLLIFALCLFAIPTFAQTLTPRTTTQNALALVYTDNAGVAHPNAVWVPVQVTFDNLDRTGGIEWYAFDSATAYNAGDQPIGGAVHLSAINATQLAAINALPGALTVQATLAEGIGYIVQNVLDTQEVVGGVPQVANGQPVMVSFFAGATPTVVG